MPFFWIKKDPGQSHFTVKWTALVGAMNQSGTGLCVILISCRLCRPAPLAWGWRCQFPSPWSCLPTCMRRPFCRLIYQQGPSLRSLFLYPCSSCYGFTKGLTTPQGEHFLWLICYILLTKCYIIHTLQLWRTWTSACSLAKQTRNTTCIPGSLIGWNHLPALLSCIVYDTICQIYGQPSL